MNRRPSLGIDRSFLLASLALGAILCGPQTAPAADGSELFRAKCIACHGPKGEGTPVGPALKGDPFIVNGAPDEIKKVVMTGRSDSEKKYPDIMNAMPGGLATESEADALVVYLKGDLQK
jgi:mono/diheme cytochrome c family protein